MQHLRRGVVLSLFSNRRKPSTSLPKRSCPGHVGQSPNFDPHRAFLFALYWSKRSARSSIIANARAEFGSREIIRILHSSDRNKSARGSGLFIAPIHVSITAFN